MHMHDDIALQVRHYFVMWLLLAKILTVGHGFCKMCNSVIFSMALLPQKWGDAILYGYEYRLDALVLLRVMF